MDRINNSGIFLIGYMGSGKSTLASKLASRLDLPSFDLDQIIEEETGETISDLFKSHGEEQFRKLESETLKSFVAKNDRFVLATGGGTPCYYDSMDFMNDSGLTVYLNMPPKALLSRLTHNQNTRPLIAGKDRDELLRFIEEQMRKREPYYLRSKLIADGLNLNLKQLTEMILNYSR